MRSSILCANRFYVQDGSSLIVPVDCFYSGRVSLLAGDGGQQIVLKLQGYSGTLPKGKLFCIIWGELVHLVSLAKSFDLPSWGTAAPPRRASPPHSARPPQASLSIACSLVESLEHTRSAFQNDFTSTELKVH